MISTAVGRYNRISPYKVRLVANMIKGKDTESALAILTFSPKKAARIVKKVLKSAIANAEQKGTHEAGTLFVRALRVDLGPMAKRFDMRAMGRAVKVRHRTSHVTIGLDK